MKPSIAFLIATIFSAEGLALDIPGAYRLIPHMQTPFHLLQSNIPTTEAKYLSKLLSLSELAMVERVDAMHHGTRKANYEKDIKRILARLAKLKAPSKLLPAQQHIVSAIQQHQAYFALTNSSDSNARSKQQQLVRSSHHHLIAAYQLLMQLYPQETKHNQRAFFDYLCALDFI